MRHSFLGLHSKAGSYAEAKSQLVVACSDGLVEACNAVDISTRTDYRSPAITFKPWSFTATAATKTFQSVATTSALFTTAGSASPATMSAPLRDEVNWYLSNGYLPSPER
jgi:hypothetical protein